MIVNLKFCLHKDERSFAGCSEVFDCHSDCLEGQSGYIFNASVTASEPSYDGGEQNSLRKFVVLLRQAVQYIFGEVGFGYLPVARATAMD